MSARGCGKLEDQEEWLKERFFRHRGNEEVVWQDLLRERSIDVGLCTLERVVAPLRRLPTAEVKPTVRFEAPPGHQAAGCTVTRVASHAHGSLVAMQLLSISPT